MKNYNFTQVQKALENKGFYPYKSFGNDTEVTTVFKQSSSTDFSIEMVTVEEWVQDGSCTIEGLCPSKSGKQQFA